MYIIYKHTNILNNKSYIGLTSKTLEERFNEHIKESTNGSSRSFHKAIRKYGVENFESTVLEDNLENYEIACEREKYFIDIHNTFYGYGNGYNMTYGGDGSVKGELNPNYGRKRPEHSAHLKELYKDGNKQHSEFMKQWHKENVHWNTGNNGELNPNYGNHMSEESKQQLKKSLAKIEKLECPHCGNLSNPGNAKRWHFDNCKLNLKNGDGN